MNGPKVDASYVKALAQFQAIIEDGLESVSLDGRALLRLAIHDSTTYESKSNTSGSNGSIRTQKELEQPGNEGLSGTATTLVKIKVAFPGLTHADAIQQAGAVAVHSAGGPLISITPGRSDSWAFPPPGRLFSPESGDDRRSVAAIREFAQRTGLLLRAVVALMGAASYSTWWGSSQADRASPFEAPPTFDNSFFRSLVEGDNPTDGWLLTDDELRQYCEEYAADQTLFFKDYAIAHEEMSRLGTRLQPTTPAALAAAHAAEASLWDTITPLQAVAAVVLAGAVVGIGAGVWWNRRRRLRRII